MPDETSATPQRAWDDPAWRSAMSANAVGTVLGGFVLAVLIAIVVAIGRYTTSSVIISIAGTAAGISILGRWFFLNPALVSSKPDGRFAQTLLSIYGVVFTVALVTFCIAGLAFIARLVWFVH